MNSVTNIEKARIFENAAQQLAKKGFTIVQQNKHKPWGGYFVIDEKQSVRFIQTYFPSIDANTTVGKHKISPKILLVAPHKRLSWQYHFRRAEAWKVISGQVGVVTSTSDIEGDVQVCATGTKISIKTEERHRLIGLNDWGIIAEIWQHIDANNPSNEADIVRLQDDFGR